jgi:lipopolysaccharide export system permease protein
LLRFLSWFGLVLVVLAAGITIAEMLLHLDDLAEDTEGLGGAMRFLGVRVCAYYLPILIPIASFMAAYLSLGISARWLEITATKAGGVSPIRVTLPVLIAAAGLSGVAFLVNETLVLEAERAWRQHLSGAEDDIEFRRGSFWYATGNLIYNVGDADPGQQILHDLRIFEKDDDGRLLRRIYASVAQVRDGDLELYDATEIRFHPDQPRSVPEKTWSSRLLLDTDAARSNPTLLEADATTLALPNLREFISQRAAAGGDVSRFVSLFHSRLSDPLAVFLLALLAIPFALKVEQTRSLAVPALQGVAVLLVYWSFRSGGALLGTSNPGAAFTAPWLVLLAFLGLGAWRYARVPS